MIIKAEWKQSSLKNFYFYETLISDNKLIAEIFARTDKNIVNYELTILFPEQEVFNFNSVKECKDKVKFFLMERNLLIANKTTKCLW